MHRCFSVVSFSKNLLRTLTIAMSKMISDRDNDIAAIVMPVWVLKHKITIDMIEHKELIIKNGFSMMFQNFFHIVLEIKKRT